MKILKRFGFGVEIIVFNKLGLESLIMCSYIRIDHVLQRYKFLYRSSKIN